MKKTKWILFAAALILLAITWLDTDFSAYRQMSPADLAPVIVISAVIFLLKAGVLSTVLIFLKKLWERIRRK